MASQSSEEITELKSSSLVDKVKVIENVGEYKYIVTVTLKNFEITIKCQLQENYPTEKPTVFVKSDAYAKDFVTELSTYLTKASTDEAHSLCDLCKLANEFTTERNPEPLERTTTKFPKYKSKTHKKKKAQQDPKENIVVKKIKLRSAEDVIKRILWDDIPVENCYVGYIDRFVGLVEKSFSAFSWEDIASVDYYTLAIPKHRIVYFKYKKLIIWDKRKRLDNVFGSTGSNITLRDVLNNYEEMSKNESDDKESAEDLVVDFGDYDKEFESTSSSEEDEQEEGNCENPNAFRNKEEYFGDKIKPNYFLCLRIDNKDIIEKTMKVRDELLKLNPQYDECIISPERLHITLCCLGLDSDNDLEQAIMVLKNLKAGIEKLNPLEANFQIKGTNHFWNTVLYADVQKTEPFMEICNYVRNEIAKSGLEIRDMFDMTPHMTLMKISRQIGHKIGTKYLDARVHNIAKDEVFGTQNFSNVCLCLMGQQRQQDGFYITPYKMEL
ncbi:DgyrCDS4526 [Dimorphilus gyrociliatus]|uniref:DgyrCDS4526 n=1 Tax=Dimorphilus gyrociliatus TaxID=2664684 RepID=A0A7I8VIP1_9ANNE|nr:DgyrCDS4526 [Dimorphilus gyrociliatus]